MRQIDLLPDLNDLYFFCRVVDEGSFTQASEELGITKSKLSRRITELEDHLGVRLLNRSTRKLSLTDVGTLVYEYSKAMVTQASSAQEAAILAQSKPRGRINVTCPTLFAQSGFSNIIINFMRLYPEVRINLYASDRKVDLIEEGFDIALRFQTNDLEDSNLVVKKLGESIHFMVGAPGYLQNRKPLTSPTELNQFSWLAKTRKDGTHQLQLTHMDRQKITVSLSSILESTDWTILKHAALEGMGITFLPQEYCQDEINEGKLVRLLPDWDLPAASFYMLYPSRRGLVPAVRHFIDFVSAETKNWSVRIKKCKPYSNLERGN